MSDACCSGDPADGPPDHFHCQGCGHCCKDLQGRWARDRGRFAPTPAAGIYRLATPGGLRMFSWEATPFRALADTPGGPILSPLLVLADGVAQRLVTIVYELDAERCPHYEEDGERRADGHGRADGEGPEDAEDQDAGHARDDGLRAVSEGACTIYEDRPLVCRSFPLLVVDHGDGPEVAASALCPSRLPVVGAATASARPQRVLGNIYPNEAAAALAVPAMMDHVVHLVDHLAGAGIVDPVAHLDEATLGSWAAKGHVDLVDVLERTGVMRGNDLRERQERTRAKLRARWVDGPGTA